MKKILLAGVCMGLAFWPASVSLAQEEMTLEEWEAQYQAHVEEILADVAPESGRIVLNRAPVILNVPTFIDYYDPGESRTILEDLWGNPPDDTVLGMLFPAGVSPADSPWGAVLTYEASGYVSDEDAESIDYDALMVEMQDDMRASNPYREQEGYETVDLVGWAVPPRYDAQGHRLEWAKDLVFGQDYDIHTLNYDMRVLGRRGVFSINFVGTLEDLNAVKQSAPDILAIPEFKANESYADYQPGDKTAGYGIAALITGGAGAVVAKKTGLIAVALIFLKKGWVIILAGLGGAFSFIRRMLGGGAKS